MLYHWAPTLITAPREVQLLARRYMFNLAAIAATLLSFAFSWFVFGNAVTRPWIGILYFIFGVVFLIRPVLSQHRARVTTASLVGLVAAAILGPVAIGLVAAKLPPLGAFSLDTQTFVMLGTALVACALAMAAILAQVDARAADARQRRAGAPVDERAAVDADGRARPHDAVGVDRAHSRIAAMRASSR